MPLPAHVKTWQFNVNQSRPTSGTGVTDSATLLLAIKNGLLGFAQNPWIVRYSCDSSTAGTAGDGIDRWSTAASLVFQSADTGTARSWIVLQNVDGLELLIECRGVTGAPTTAKGIRVIMSAGAGFTGGSTTARPTATDEIVLLDGLGTSGAGYGAGAPTNTAGFDAVLHMWHADDGQVTMWIICHAGAPTAFAYFGRVDSPVSGWTYPYIGAWIAAGTNLPHNALTYDALVDGTLGGAAYPRAGARFPAGSYPVFFSSEAGNTGARTATTTQAYGKHILTVNQITNEWETCQIGVMCVTAGARGKHGRLFDVRWVSNGLTTGDTAPADGSKTWAVFGSMLLPWDGSVPVAA